MYRTVIGLGCLPHLLGKNFADRRPPGHWLCGAALVAASIGAAAPASAKNELARPIPTYPKIPKGPPSFFVTSVGLSGGDLGGLAGADAHCQTLARNAGFKATGWRAYLSTQASPGKAAVNARDRIGKGPWFNVQGIRVAENLAHLHGDTLAYARGGNLVSQATALTERGDRIGGKGDPKMLHDILTGSTAAGRAFNDRYDRTCRNWTYSGLDGSAQIGHSDRDSLGLSISWNSAHHTAGCTPAKLELTGGAGLFYCFAKNLPPADKAAMTEAVTAPLARKTR